MGIKRIVLLLFFATMVLTLHLQFSNKEDVSEEGFRQIIAGKIKFLATEIDSLNTIASLFNEDAQSIGNLRAQLKKTRKAYKNIEAVLEYYYPKHIKAYINGAPLDHLDPYPIKADAKKTNYYGVSPEEYSRSLPLDNLNTDHYKGKQKVVSPMGLQMLDELVFSDGAYENKILILELSSALQKDFQVIETAFGKRKFFKSFEIIEASRVELVRIFSMGVTGFDTPGSQNALDEAASSIQGLKEVLQPLLKQSEASQQQKVVLLFDNSIAYLKKNTNFDTFDRLTFLTSFINPLYKELLQVQIALNIKSSSEIYEKVPSWNAYSDNIFSEDFLNPYYYSLLKKKEDSGNLRQLGKQLFYDEKLSNSGKISCASCHKPEMAFSDGIKTSLSGIEGKNVLRNAPSLINAVFSDRYFYDLRAFDLEEQAGHVIENHLEFDTTFPELVEKLNADNHYVEEFESLFGGGKITRYQFSSALSSYVISLRSFNSHFDQYVQGKTNKIDNQVRLGFNLFMGKANCATCHFAPTFSGLVPPLYNESESEVLGVLKDPNVLVVDNDWGRFGNGLPEDNEKIYRNSFKTTTVRNTKLTAPYFHNGAYNTLDEVIDFYNKGGAAGMGLSYEVPNQTLPSDELNLNKKEIKALIAFIESLTDNPSVFKN